MRLYKRSLAVAALLTIPTLACTIQHAGAWPTQSPSARAAARLKYHPPYNWIRHYLGDDRYKIQGGVWKVVSTHSDTYYHRASCPNMLRQSADIVIGFNKSKEAADDGYRSDPVCQPDATAYIYSGSGGASSPDAGGPSLFTNAASKTRTITLSDGKSTVGLPSGWTHIRGKKQTTKTGFFAFDMLQPPTRRGQVMISTASMPGVIDASMLRDAKKFQANLQQFKTLNSRSGIVDNRLSELNSIFDNITVKQINFAGLPGVLVTPGQTNSKFKLGQSWSTGRGSTMYSITDMTQKAKGLGTIVSTYKPR